MDRDVPRRRGQALSVDLGALAGRWREPAPRALPWVGSALAVVSVGQLVLQLVGGGDTWLVVAAAGQLIAGAGLVVTGRSARVTLEPDGYRVGDALWSGRLRPWSGVAEVRAPSRWTRHAEIRGTRAGDRPVALAGMTAEQAVGLQRRLDEARVRAQKDCPS